ncbi:DUF2523 family protein [Stutzerimonas stutzeri]|uniref:DUF2523 family protein n=1 Tax=Stutzerimonas stutzeri TaxID=316 RepID=UPI001C7738D2|nr:DUF2523 family protein [Stutzerimonas stutzeri]BCY03532.1 hypothetical protein PszF2a_33210 [Stutzerimonas stutzeri]
MIEAIKSFFKSLFDPVWDAFQRLFDFFNEFFSTLFEAIRAAISELFIHIQGWAWAVIYSLPVPDFVYDAKDALQGIPPSVVYFTSAFQIGPGLTIILGAYVLRFLIRRIPIIG